jgi:preprotein translocase subunit SecD
MSCNSLSFNKAYDKQPNDGFEYVQMKTHQNSRSKNSYWVRKQILLNGSRIEESYVKPIHMELPPEEIKRIKAKYPGIKTEQIVAEPGWQISLVFKKEKDLINLIKGQQGQRLALVLDSELLMAPKIHGTITGTEVTIFGSFSHQRATEIAERINGLQNCTEQQ